MNAHQIHIQKQMDKYALNYIASNANFIDEISVEKIKKQLAGSEMK